MTDAALQFENRSRWPHVFAVILACATFPLIWVGGLVTTYDAGMAVPDWPTTYGYNMFLYPVSTWVSGPWNLFIEHGHRLLGSLVGLLTIVLNVVIWKTDSRRWMRVVGAVALLLVISQGLLGGMRVQLGSTDFARAHGVTGPLFFAFTVMICVMTSRFWWSVPQTMAKQDDTVQQDASGENTSRRGMSRRAIVHGWMMFGIAYFQLVIGAHLRHPNVDWSPGLFRTVVVFHILAALMVLIQAIQVASQARKLTTTLRRPAWLLLALVACQLLLGVATWRAKYGMPSFVPVAENAVDQPMEIAMHNAIVGQTIQNAGMVQVLTVTLHVAVGSLILAASAYHATRLNYAWLVLGERRTSKSKVSSRHVLSTVSVMGGATS